MLFVLIFVSALLVVPVVIDIDRNGTNNIFRRSGEDLLNYSYVKQALLFFHVSTKKLQGAAMTVVGVVSTIAALIIGWELLRILYFIVRLF